MPPDPPGKREETIPSNKRHTFQQKAFLKITQVDDHFAPSVEQLDVTYQIRGLINRKVFLEVTSARYSENPIYKRELTHAEKQNGEWTLRWDGLANCASGDLKDRYIHPLLAPYKVRIYEEGNKYSDEKEFKVLYHSLALRQGPWTPDGQKPPKTEKEKYAQFRLNELGYYGGPVGKDTQDYLKKAVIRYRANHKDLHKLKYSDYTGDVTDELVTALENDTRPPRFLVGDAFSSPTGEAKVYVEALTYQTNAEFSGQTKATDDPARLNRPLIPIEVDVFLKAKESHGNGAVRAPEAVGPVRINWRMEDPDEDLARQFPDDATTSGFPRRYVEKALKVKSGRSGANGDNCHTDFLGARLAPASYYKTPFLTGDFYLPYDVKDDGGQKVVYSKANVDKAYPQRVGKAGVLFRPSLIAGDDYRLKAEIDFTDEPNKSDLESFHNVTSVDTRIHVQAGRFQVWRRGKVLMTVDWPRDTSRPSYMASNSASLPLIKAEYEKAFIEIDTSSVLSRTITQVLTEPQYKTIVTTHTAHKDASKVRLLPDSYVGVDIPVQGKDEEPAAYMTRLRTFAHQNFNQKTRGPIQEQVSANVRKEHPTGFIFISFLLHRPVDVRAKASGVLENLGITKPKVVRAGYIAGTASVGLADSVILLTETDTDKLYYVASHEMGHSFYLQHWEHAGDFPDHDTDDHNCIMSYSDNSCAHAHHRVGVYTPHFCGRCNLKLRGWNIKAAGIPAKSS